MNSILRNVFDNNKVRKVIEVFGFLVASGRFGETHRLIWSLLGPSVTLAKWSVK